MSVPSLGESKLHGKKTAWRRSQSPLRIVAILLAALTAMLVLGQARSRPTLPDDSLPEDDALLESREVGDASRFQWSVGSKSHDDASDDAELLAAHLEDPPVEPAQRHLGLFLAEVRAQAPVPTLRSFLKLYTSLDAKKLAGFLDADEEEMVQQLMVMKQASRSVSRVGDEKGLLDGQMISTKPESGESTSVMRIGQKVAS